MGGRPVSVRRVTDARPCIAYVLLLGPRLSALASVTGVAAGADRGAAAGGTGVRKVIGRRAATLLLTLYLTVVAVATVLQQAGQ